MSPIIRVVVNSVWFLLKCGLLAALIAAVLALPHLDRRVDEEIRRRIQAALAAHYSRQPGLKVTLRSAELVRGKGIVLRGLKISEPAVQGPEGELLQFEEVFLTCPTEIPELLKAELQIRGIVIRRPTLRVVRRPDGSWSAAKLLPLPRSGQPAAEVVLERGTVEIVDPPRAPLVLREVSCRLASAAPAQSGAPPGMRSFSARFVADMLGQVELSGMVDPHRPQWTIAGSVQGLEFSPELVQALPAELAAKLPPVSSLRGQARLEFTTSHDPDAPTPYRFQVSGHLTGARLDDPRLPHSITDIRAGFRCDNEGWEVPSLSARCGQSEFQLSWRRQGFDGQGPIRLKAELRDLELDAKYVELLPEVLQDQWHRYRPSGRIHAQVDLSYDGSSWHPDVAIQCLSVAFSYDRFPYRLESSQGTIELKNDVLTASLIGYSGSRPIRVEVEVHHPLSGSYGWLKARGDDLPLDEKLLAAMPKRTRAVVRSLEPHGTIDFSGELWRDRPTDPVHRHLVVALNRCSIRYRGFPYPISNLRGTLEMLDDRWTFRDLVGTNDTGRLACEGSLEPTPEGNRLRLRLTGENVPVEEELRDALSPAMRQAWNDFKPQGRVDLQEATIDLLPGQDKADVEVRLRPRSENASITPVYFPYRLEKLRGLMVYRNGEVRLEGFSGEHGNARFWASGKGAFLPDGSWHFQLEGLRAERLRLDRELTRALPERLKKAVEELNPTGPIYLAGRLLLARGGRPDDPITADWDVQIGFDQAAIDFGLRLENMYGTVRLVGGSDGQHLATRGQLQIESFTYRDYQFRQVHGPIWIDDQRILFGSWVDRPLIAQPRPESARPPAAQPISGQLFGGTLLADAWVALGTTPRYALRAALVQGDLARLAQETLPARQGLRGSIHAEVDLQGEGRSLTRLGGHGKLRLRDANLYELPLVLALLKILRIRQPDKTAFSTSDVDFRLEGGHIYLDRISFAGDAISLVGNGEMNYQGEIRLALHAMVGRGELNLPVLQQVLGGASQQIMLIHVGGTLQNPQTIRVPFPGVNQALQQIQADWQNGNGVSKGLSPLSEWSAEALRALPKRR